MNEDVPPAVLLEQLSEVFNADPPPVAELPFALEAESVKDDAVQLELL